MNFLAVRSVASRFTCKMATAVLASFDDLWASMRRFWVFTTSEIDCTPGEKCRFLSFAMLSFVLTSAAMSANILLGSDIGRAKES